MVFCSKEISDNQMNNVPLHRRSVLQAALGLLAAVSAEEANAETVAGAATPSPSLTPVATAIDPAKLIAAQLKLGRSLLGILARGSHSKPNIVVSPASLTGILALLDLGASDEMRSALHRALGFDEVSKKSAAADFEGVRVAVSSISKRTNEGGPLMLANLIVFDPSTRPFQLALLGLGAAGADVSVEDLGKSESIGRINDWVKNRTKGLIPAVLDETPDELGLVAVNALYFKDRWKTPFDSAETRVQPFHAVGGKSIEVPMMHLPEGKYVFRQNGNFVAVELPYAADDYKLVLITTKTGSAQAHGFAGVASWLGGQDFTLRSGELAMPRFSSSESVELLEPLDALGLREARRKSNALGAFSPVSQTISQIVQKTELHVNEEGTEAAAATTVTTTRSISPQSEYIKMVVDKPFVFALRDQRTGLLLLIGYIGQPGGKPFR
jgi:serine protease inhibitor